MATVSTTLPSDGQTIDASDVNTPINAILSEFNGNIDNDNIKTGANINGAKLLASSLPGSSFDTTLAGGWISGGLPAYSSATNNGNKSYDIVFASTVASLLSPGMRLRTTRTVTAPTQCADLEASSSQYFNKTTPNKLTFTDDFVVSAWVKLESYAVGTIASRFSGTSGWALILTASGQVELEGYNAGAGNYSLSTSYQSIPLGKWVHITAQLDMSAFTDSTTTSYVMIDGVDVPISVARAGTNPTALVQAGNLEIGGRNGGLQPFDGKIAQVAIFNAKVTQATMRGYISQGLSGSETSLASAYSLNNSLLDLNTTTPNDLTAQNSAVATNADSPFGQDSNGVTAGTTDYALVMKVSTTTATVQVPEGCTIPTSGGVSAVAYSTATSPFGFTLDKGRWKVSSRLRTNSVTTSNATYGAYQSGGYALTVPAGAWKVGHQHGALVNPTTTAVTFNISPTALTGLTVNTGFDASPFAIKITSPAAAETNNAATLSDQVSQSAAQTWVMYTIGATASASIQGAQATSEIYAIPAGI